MNGTCAACQPFKFSNNLFKKWENDVFIQIKLCHNGQWFLKSENLRSLEIKYTKEIQHIIEQSLHISMSRRMNQELAHFNGTTNTTMWLTWKKKTEH